MISPTQHRLPLFKEKSFPCLNHLGKYMRTRENVVVVSTQKSKIFFSGNTPAKGNQTIDTTVDLEVLTYHVDSVG